MDKLDQVCLWEYICDEKYQVEINKEKILNSPYY